MLYKLLGFFWAAIPILLIGSFSAALIYYKPNNKPFINMVEAGLKYALQDKLFVWEQRQVKKDRVAIPSLVNDSAQQSARLNSNKLRDLAWSLDVLDLHKKEVEEN